MIGKKVCKSIDRFISKIKIKQIIKYTQHMNAISPALTLR